MHVSDEQKKIITRILLDLVPTARVSVFGSRATGTKKKFSDLDLLIHTKTKLSLRNFRRLKEAFTDSSLPFRVDIVDANTASEEFLKEIETDAIVIQGSGSRRL